MVTEFVATSVRVILLIITIFCYGNYALRIAVTTIAVTMAADPVEGPELRIWTAHCPTGNLMLVCLRVLPVVDLAIDIEKAGLLSYVVPPSLLGYALMTASAETPDFQVICTGACISHAPVIFTVAVTLPDNVVAVVAMIDAIQASTGVLTVAIFCCHLRKRVLYFYVMSSISLDVHFFCNKC